MGRQALRSGIAGRVLLATGVAASVQAGAEGPVRQAERLDRGVVAVPAKGGGVLVDWRSLASDPKGVGFDVYRDGRKVTSAPVTQSTNFRDPDGTPASHYAVRMIAPGTAGAMTPAVPVWAKGYWSIPLDPLRAGRRRMARRIAIRRTTSVWATWTGTASPIWC